MATSPIRLNPSLIAAAEREGRMQKRTVPKQIEFWADLGRAVEGVVDLSDLFAVRQGLKRLKLESIDSEPVDAAALFDDLRRQMDSGQLSDAVTGAAVYFEASSTHPGMLDRVDAATGNRQTGQFQNGTFESLG